MSEIPHVLLGAFLSIVEERGLFLTYEAADGTEERSLWAVAVTIEEALEKAIDHSIEAGIGLQLPNGARLHGRTRASTAFMARSLLGLPNGETHH